MTSVLNATTSYWVRASNAAGGVDSATARIAIVKSPSFTATLAGSNTLLFRFQSEPGTRWTVEHAEDLRTWEALPGIIIDADGDGRGSLSHSASAASTCSSGWSRYAGVCDGNPILTQFCSGMSHHRLSIQYPRRQHVAS